MDDQFIMISGEAHAELNLRPTLALAPFAAFSWRSLGGHFDYETWPDRERFLKLDKAIRLAKAQQREENPEQANEPAPQLCVPRDESDVLTISPVGTIMSRFLSSNEVQSCAPLRPFTQPAAPVVCFEEVTR
jgi:hypothetical protein